MPQPSPSIEVELRSFITDAEYEQLEAHFHACAEFLGEEDQVTYHLDAPGDLRIQQSTSRAKVWFKTGTMHAEDREEIEIKIEREEFEKLKLLFERAGHTVTSAWFRKRKTFRWDDINVMLDDTRGYGRILELECLVAPEEVEATKERLRKKFDDLAIVITPKEEFDRAYADYRQHWRERTGKA